MGPMQREQPEANSTRESASATIYVVDGDSAALNGIRALVQTLEVEVSCYQTAEDFLDAADFERPGCLIAEVHLPGISGIDLQEALRRRGVNYPVILIASQADVRMAVRAMALGALDFIEKPFVGRLLLSRVKQALRSAA
jgi:two-component system response regulator FixJ